MSYSVGTSAAAQVFVALAMFHGPTVSAVPGAVETYVRPASQRVAAKTYDKAFKSAALTVANEDLFEASSRQTTATEILIGEIRNWTLLDSNWDGEDAHKPSYLSIKDTVAFAQLMKETLDPPEPMLLASGNSALFWHEEELYADLEFLGDGRVAYFIKKNDDKHKGVVTFDSENMPVMFQSLLNI